MLQQSVNKQELPTTQNEKQMEPNLNPEFNLGPILHSSLILFGEETMASFCVPSVNVWNVFNHFVSYKQPLSGVIKGKAVVSWK